MAWTRRMPFSPLAERFALPVFDPPAQRSPFPLVATLAPVVVSVVVWALTGSAFALLFALLGPIVAVGGVLDSSVGRRRAARAAGRRWLVGAGALEERL